MAHRIDWDNIHLHIHETDARYQRRLRRKQLYIECSPSVNNVSAANGSLKKLKSVKDQIFKGNHELVVACPNVVSNVKPIRVEFGGEKIDADSELEIFKEGFTEGGKSLVCRVEDDVSLKKVENVQDQKFLCNDVDTELEMFEEGLREGGKSLVCKVVEDNVSDDVSLKIVENVQDQKFLCNDADPDLEMFEEGLREGGKSLVCKVVEDNVSDDVSLKIVENVQDQKFLCNDADPDLEMFEEGFTEGGKSLVCKVDEDASDEVGLKKLKNVQDQKFLCNDLYLELEMFKVGVRDGNKSLVCEVDEDASDEVGLKKLKNVQDQKFLCNDLYLELEMFKVGVRDGNKSLVCEVDDRASDDVFLKKLENVQDRKFLCCDLFPELEMFKEDLREGGKSLVCKVEHSASDDVSLKKLENVNDQKFLCNEVDPDLEIFKEGLREGGKSLVCEVEDYVSNNSNLKKLENAQDQKFLCNDVSPGLEMFEEGLRDGGKSLVCKVDDNASDDVSFKKLENVQEQKFLCDDEFWVECSNVVSNPEPIGVICGTREDAVDPDFTMFKEDIKEERHLFASSVVGVKKLGNVQEQDLRNDELRVNCRDSEFKSGAKRMTVDPDYKKFVEDLKVDAHSYALKVKKNDGSLLFLGYEKDVLHKDNQRTLKGDNVKNVPGKQTGDTANYLKNNTRKEKRDKVVPRREGFSGNSNRSPVTKRSSVVKRRNNMEIISIGKPIEMEEVIVGKNNRPSKTIRDKRQRPLNLDDGRNIKHLRKSKKKYEKVERMPCLTRIDHVSNLMDIAGKSKRHYRRTSPRSERRDLMVQQGEDIENLRFSSDIGNMDVMVKEEKFDDSTKAVVKKRRQMIQGRDGVNDNNKRPRYKCDKKFGKYAEVKEVNANSLNYDEDDNERRDLMVQQGEDIENSRFSFGIGNMDVMVKEEKFDSSTNTVVKKRRQMIQGRDSVIKKRRQMIQGIDSLNDNNLRPRYKCDQKFGKYAGVKEVNANGLNYDEDDNERRDLMVHQGEDIENSRFSFGIGNMDVMVKEEKFDNSTNTVVKKTRQMIQGRDSVIKKRRQMIQGIDSVNDNNLRPRYKCDQKFGKYAGVKEVNANSLNYDEEDTEHSSDLEILDTDNKLNLRKFEVMKVFNASVIEDYPLSRESPSDYENPEFREELMDILRRPFNLEEYRSLMQKAKYRHLMGGPEYSDGLKGKEVSNTYGKSPLDYHPDVQKRLRQCRKIARRLNILRGFIYWYERACQNGAFKPWLDKSCAAVTPSFR